MSDYRERLKAQAEEKAAVMRREIGLAAPEGVTVVKRDDIGSWSYKFMAGTECLGEVELLSKGSSYHRADKAPDLYVLKSPRIPSKSSYLQGSRRYSKVDSFKKAVAEFISPVTDEEKAREAAKDKLSMWTYRAKLIRRNIWCSACDRKAIESLDLLASRDFDKMVEGSEMHRELVVKRQRLATFNRRLEKVKQPLQEIVWS